VQAARPYLPPEVPRPWPCVEDAPFWAACAERRLVFQACAACGRLRHPPGPRCPHCRSGDVRWTPAPPAGRVFSYTVVHHPMHEATAASVPYNVVLVEFPGLDGVRLVSNVVDAQPGQLEVGLEVELCWEPTGDGGFLPRFRRGAP
jgi:uncharacterized OB-fold protein